METITGINISREELGRRHEKIREGNSLEEVTHILGGSGYKIEEQGKKKIVFWRFVIRDAASSRAQYELFKGEFEKNKLIFGALLPQG
jgi:hypothetical protein